MYKITQHVDNVLQSPKSVTAYLKSKQLLYFGFPRKNIEPHQKRIACMWPITTGDQTTQDEMFTNILYMRMSLA